MGSEMCIRDRSGLDDTIRRLQSSVNPSLTIEGLIRTMFDGRNSLTNEVSAQLRQYYPNLIYETVIPRNVRLAEAPSFGKSVIDYDPICQGALAYKQLATEMLQSLRSSETPDASTVVPGAEHES